MQMLWALSTWNICVQRHAPGVPVPCVPLFLLSWLGLGACSIELHSSSCLGHSLMELNGSVLLGQNANWISIDFLLHLLFLLSILWLFFSWELFWKGRFVEGLWFFAAYMFCNGMEGAQMSGLHRCRLEFWFPTMCPYLTLNLCKP